MRAKKNTHTNDKEKGTGITKYTGQRKINERHSTRGLFFCVGDVVDGAQHCHAAVFASDKR